uniref:DNTTIP1_dimer domain-containing protein n=1 Tax=Anopheles christyi TaxID=43041 RepID=A0A182JYZ3_9DIPT
MVIQRVWRSAAASSSLNAPPPPPPAAAVAPAAAPPLPPSSSSASTTTVATCATSSTVVVATTTATSASEATSTNSSGSTTANTAESEAGSVLPTGMRQKLKNALSGEATLEALKQRYGTGRSFVSQTANDAAIKSLELLRANIQCYFDKEVDTIVKKFHQTYFVPAIRNIKENLGEGAISEEALKSVFCSLLENTKAQYASQLSSPAGNSLSRANTPGMELSDSDSSTDNAPATGAATSLLHQALKRKLPEPNQPDLFKRQYFLHGPIFPHVPYQSLPTSQSQTSGSNLVTSVSSRHMSVPTTVITPESLFILDFKAARVLGISDFRDRLANRHPEVLRYCPDTQDRDWLLQQRQVTPLNKNGRFFLLPLDDVKKLIERNAFEHTASTGRFGELQGFKVTEMIYAKIQKLLKELTERQRTTDGFESPKVPPVVGTATTGRPRISSLSSSHATLTALLSTPQPQTQTSESVGSSSTLEGELKRS